MVGTLYLLLFLVIFVNGQCPPIGSVVHDGQTVSCEFNTSSPPKSSSIYQIAIPIPSNASSIQIQLVVNSKDAEVGYDYSTLIPLCDRQYQLAQFSHTCSGLRQLKTLATNRSHSFTFNSRGVNEENTGFRWRVGTNLYFGVTSSPTSSPNTTISLSISVNIEACNGTGLDCFPTLNVDQLTGNVSVPVSESGIILQTKVPSFTSNMTITIKYESEKQIQESESIVGSGMGLPGASYECADGVTSRDDGRSFHTAIWQCNLPSEGYFYMLYQPKRTINIISVTVDNQFSKVISIDAPQANDVEDYSIQEPSYFAMVIPQSIRSDPAHLMIGCEPSCWISVRWGGLSPIDANSLISANDNRISFGNQTTYIGFTGRQLRAGMSLSLAIIPSSTTQMTLRRVAYAMPQDVSSNFYKLPSSTSELTSASTSSSTSPSISPSSFILQTSSDSPLKSSTMQKELETENSNTGAIIGGVIGGLAAVIIVIILGLLILRMVKNRKKSDGDIHMEAMPRLSIDRDVLLRDIQVKEKLGGGKFGEVYRGVWQGTTAVALKRLREDDMSDDFDRECQFLQSFAHKNIVQFLGVYQQHTDRYMVTEYLTLGALDLLLQKERASPPPVKQLLFMARDAAAGMNYLAGKGVIHRDLAARNLLVASGTDDAKYQVKVADFGMARVTKSEDAQYYVSNDRMIPIKWSAIEVLVDRKFSIQSDVWSFGIVLWEIFSFGKVPYPVFSNEETFNRVTSGYRLPQPDGCPDGVHHLALRCWDADPAQRPTFKELFDALSAMIDDGHSISIPQNIASDFHSVSTQETYQ